jgi:hypothetical protein
MGSIVDKAKHEFELIGTDGLYGDLLRNSVLEVLEVLENQNHSGFSAGVIIKYIDRLWAGKPLSPLTGEDDEWSDLYDGDLQNKRYSSVFKNKNTGECYNIEGRIFVEPDGTAFSCSESAVPVQFPYTVPDTPEYIYLKYDSGKKNVSAQLRDGDFKIKK